MSEFRREMAKRCMIKAFVNTLIAAAVTITFMLLQDYIFSSPFSLSRRFIRTAEIILIILGVIFWFRTFHFMFKSIEYSD